MGLIKTIKALKTLNTVSDYIQEHENIVQKAKTLINRLSETADFLKNHKEQAEAYLHEIEAVIEKLKRLIKD